MAEIALARVTKRFRTVTAIDAMDLTIADGEFFVLLGRPAPARPPRSAWWRASRRWTRGGSPSPGMT
jgi:hypothetical protein